MEAFIEDLVDAVVFELNDDPLTNFGMSFEAEPSNGEDELLLKDIGSLVIHVVPAGHPLFILADRGSNIDHQATVQIVIRKRMKVGSDKKLPRAEVRELRLLTQKIAALFVELELSTLTNATWLVDENRQPIETDGFNEHMRQSQYTGVVRMTYQLVAQ